MIYSSGSPIWSLKDISRRYLNALLSEGSYDGRLYAFDSSGSTNTVSSYVPLTVAKAAAGDPGELVSYGEAPDGSLICIYEKDCNWLEARELADSQGGIFADPGDVRYEYCEFFSKLVQEYGHVCWVGLEGFSNPGWSTSAGSVSFNQYKWDAGQPDNGRGYGNCMAIGPNGYLNDIQNTGDTDDEWDVKGYIVEYTPIAINISPVVGELLEGTELTHDDLNVTVAFSNGVLITTDNYVLEQSGTEAGDQTIAVKYRNHPTISDTITIHLNEAMPTT